MTPWLLSMTLFYLRANNQFAADMEEYVETGELLDVDVGYHTQYI